jgi:hypothetical protein
MWSGRPRPLPLTLLLPLSLSLSWELPAQSINETAFFSSKRLLGESGKNFIETGKPANGRQAILIETE